MLLSGAEFFFLLENALQMSLWGFFLHVTRNCTALNLSKQFCKCRFPETKPTCRLDVLKLHNAISVTQAVNDSRCWLMILSSVVEAMKGAVRAFGKTQSCATKNNTDLELLHKGQRCFAQRHCTPF